MQFLYGVLMFILLISSKVIHGDNFTCHVCYYSVEHSEEWSKTECMNTPGKYGVSVTLPCKESFFCIIQEIYDIVSEEVVEFSRSCGEVGYETGCTKDTYHVICRNSCKGNFCNRNDTANLHELYYFNSSEKSFNNLYLFLILLSFSIINVVCF